MFDEVAVIYNMDAKTWQEVQIYVSIWYSIYSYNICIYTNINIPIMIKSYSYST